jgi:hypothetical protein
MPELARTIVSRLRAFVGNRRRNRRCAVRLPFTVTLANRRLSSNGSGRVRWLEGFTQDVCYTGLGLIVPAIRIGEHYLVGDDRRLLVVLELPIGPVEMQVVPVRYESFGEDEAETGYVIGTRIAEMSDEGRALYEDFVHRLLHQAPLD